MAVDRIMGWGDYTINKNTIAIPSQADSVPLFGKGEIRVCHKEYIGTISSTVNFASAGMALNPGLANSFPWLSTIAQNFEMYNWNGIVFQFISTSADALNSTNTALGKIVLATDYNAEDSLMVDIQQMMGTEFSNMGKPSNNIMHAIECAPDQQAVKKYWVRTGTVPDGQDKRLYDLGIFQIATEGSQAEAVIGDLWVTYDVTLSKPVMNTQLGYTLPVSHFYSADTVANTSWFGVTREQQPGSNIDGLTVFSNLIQFPVDDHIGTYMVSYTVNGSTAGALAIPTIATQSCSLKTGLISATLGRLSNEGVSDNVFFITQFIQIDGRDAQLQFNSGTGVMPSNGNKMDLWICRIPHDINS